MEELFKLKRIDEAEGTRKIAGFLAFGAAAAQLIGLFLPVLTVGAFGENESFSFFKIAGYNGAGLTWILILFLFVLTVAQAACGLLTFSLGSGGASMLSLFLQQVFYNSLCSTLPGFYRSFVHRGPAQLMFLLAVLLNVAAVVLTVLSKSSAPAGGYAAPAQPYAPPAPNRPVPPMAPAQPMQPAAPRDRSNIVAPAGMPVHAPAAQPAAQQPMVPPMAPVQQPAQQPVVPPVAPMQQPMQPPVPTPAAMEVSPELEATVFLGQDAPQEQEDTGATVFMAPPEKRAMLTRLATNEMFTISSRTGAVIGRKPENTIALSNRLVSGTHARIFFKDGAFWLEDQHSTNGTTVNGQPLAANSPVQLSDGAKIVFADEQTEFHLL
ncbi:MAG: FHA domain-containing protein [Faecalibacterium prausnitzii]|nr:FHA domain-containing protein [Faecalibacterium prausnitzii]